MPQIIQIIIKALFVLLLTIINYIGVKEAGRVNDVLTIIKVTPIILLTIIGIAYFIIKPTLLVANFTPFTPLGFGGLGSALILIFWAYIGFELVTIPTDEIINAKKIIPLAIGLGMGIITLFYVITNFVVLGTVPWMNLSAASAPLALAGYLLLGSIGALILAVGALFSISGSDEAGILTSARIPYAMAGDGLLPHFFARVHPKYRTPYIALIIQNTITLIAAIFGTISQLIILSVFTILFCYLITCISVFPLRKKFSGGIKLPSIVPVLGIIVCIYMISQTAISEIIIGSILILIGIPIYIKYAPRTEIKTVKKDIRLGRDYFSKQVRLDEIFLANFIRQIRKLINRIT
jgi:amino acid transporter